MTYRTLRIIYAMKRSKEPWDKALTDFMTKDTMAGVRYLSQIDLNHLMREAFIDYVSTCDHPEDVVKVLLNRIDNNGSMGLAHHIAIVLIQQQVQKVDEDGNWYYINGFRNID